MSWSFAAVAAFFAGSAPLLPSGAILSVDDAVRIATQNAFLVRIQSTVVEKNRQKIKEAQSNLGPKLNVNGSYTRFDQATTQQFGPATVTTSPVESTTSGLSLSLPIDIAGNQRRLIQANKFAYHAAQQTLAASINDARLSARSAYYAVLRAQAQVAVQQQNLDDAMSRASQAELQLKQNEIAKIDAFRFRTQVDQAKADLIAAQNSLKIAQYNFNNVLAIPIETEVKLIDIKAVPTFSVRVDTLVTLANAKRPEIAALNDTINSLSNVRRATESTLNPSLSLSATFSHNFAPLSGVRADQSSATLALTIPVFDSGSTRAKVKEARQDELAAKIQLEQSKLGISQEVRVAMANLMSAQARLANAIEQTKLAEETYRISIVKRDAGEGTYFEVVDALTQLTLSRSNEISARYDALTAYSQIQRAVGTDDLAQSASLSKGGSPNLGGID